MGKKSNLFSMDLFRSVAAALLIALIGAAVKMYLDVQELKLKFEYVNGSWKVPAEGARK